MTAEMIEIAAFGIAILAYLYRLERKFDSRLSALEARMSRLEGMFEGFLAAQKSPT